MVIMLLLNKSHGFMVNLGVYSRSVMKYYLYVQDICNMVTNQNPLGCLATLVLPCFALDIRG